MNRKIVRMKDRWIEIQIDKKIDRLKYRWIERKMGRTRNNDGWKDE